MIILFALLHILYEYVQYASELLACKIKAKTSILKCHAFAPLRYEWMFMFTHFKHISLLFLWRKKIHLLREIFSWLTKFYIFQFCACFINANEKVDANISWTKEGLPVSKHKEAKKNSRSSNYNCNIGYDNMTSFRK